MYILLLTVTIVLTIMYIYMFVMILETILQEQRVQWNECLRSESCFGVRRDLFLLMNYLCKNCFCISHEIILNIIYSIHNNIVNSFI